MKSESIKEEAHKDDGILTSDIITKIIERCVKIKEKF